MTMRKAICFYIIAFACFSHPAFAQDCLELFNKAFQKMKKLPESSIGLSMKYGVHVQMTDGTIHSDNVEVTMSNKRAKIVSDDFTIYQDAKTMVMIQPDAGTIFMTTPVDDATKKTQLQTFVMLQDSLFKYLELKNCAAENINGENLKKISFHLPSFSEGEFPLSSVVYWIEEATLSIKKIKLNYMESDEQQIRSMDFEFKKMSDQYQGSPFDGTAIARVLDAKNSLRAEYKNYQIIDKR